MRVNSVLRKATTIRPEVPDGKYEWLKRLFWMEDTEVKMICGSDATLYLIYLKYCAILFGISKSSLMLTSIVAFFSCAVLLPVFRYADSKVIVNSYLERLTLINAKDQYYQVWIVFFFTIVYSMLGHMLLYFFEEKRKALQFDLTTDANTITEVEISNHTILLRGINKKLPLKLVQ